MHELSRRGFLLGAVPAAAEARRPNVLLIMCDQLNPAVLGIHGGPVETPHIERIARTGVVFRGATCTTPFCSPSRASILTGLYPHAHGIVYNVSGKDYPAAGGPATEGIRQTDVTTEGILSEAGYATHQYGKWHLSGDELPYLPDQYGEHKEYAGEMGETVRKVSQRPPAEWLV